MVEKRPTVSPANYMGTSVRILCCNHSFEVCSYYRSGQLYKTVPISSVRVGLNIREVRLE